MTQAVIVVVVVVVVVVCCIVVTTPAQQISLLLAAPGIDARAAADDGYTALILACANGLAEQACGGARVEGPPPLAPPDMRDITAGPFTSAARHATSQNSRCSRPTEDTHTRTHTCAALVVRPTHALSLWGRDTPPHSFRVVAVQTTRPPDSRVVT